MNFLRHALASLLILLFTVSSSISLAGGAAVVGHGDDLVDGVTTVVNGVPVRNPTVAALMTTFGMSFEQATQAEGWIEAGASIVEAGGGLVVAVKSGTVVGTTRVTPVRTGDVAPNTGPRVPRVDVSDDLVPTRNQNVDAQYRYGDPDTGHGIEVTVDNGALSIDVAARGDASALGSGTDMFNSAMLRLQRDGVAVDRIQGIWIPGTGSDNFAQFNANIAAGMTRSEAAQNTWTGRIAASHGFTEAIETTRPGSSVIDFDFVRP